MPPHDPAHPERAHPEAAGWVLGVLDPGNAVRFAAHLESCPGCRAAVAELAPAAGMLRAAAPAGLPPPDLQARTLARVRQAAAETRPDRAPARRARWRRWNARMLTLAAAVVIAVGVGVGLLVSQTGGGLSFTIPLHSSAGQAAAGQAVAHQADGGWSIQLTVAHLPDLGPGRFYECWYAGPGTPARPPTADHRRHLHRRPLRHRHRPDVERRRPPHLPCHADHRRGRGRRRPARPRHPHRHPHQLGQVSGLS